MNVLLFYPQQMWCSSSTFTSAGSTGLTPTGSTSLAPAEWTRCRTIRQRRMLLLPQLRPSRTNQRGRRKTTKQDLYLPPWSLAAEGKRTCEIKAGREGSCCLAVMDTTSKKEKKKMQFSCSDFCVEPQRIIFSVDLVNSSFCSMPSRFAVQVK